MWWRALLPWPWSPVESAALVPPWPRRALLDADGRVIYGER